jgi:hypothetical protein
MSIFSRPKLDQEKLNVCRIDSQCARLRISNRISIIRTLSSKRRRLTHTHSPRFDDLLRVEESDLCCVVLPVRVDFAPSCISREDLNSDDTRISQTSHKQRLARNSQKFILFRNPQFFPFGFVFVNEISHIKGIDRCLHKEGKKKSTREGEKPASESDSWLAGFSFSYLPFFFAWLLQRFSSVAFLLAECNSTQHFGVHCAPEWPESETIRFSSATVHPFGADFPSNCPRITIEYSNRALAGFDGKSFP